MLLQYDCIKYTSVYVGNIVFAEAKGLIEGHSIAVRSITGTDVNNGLFITRVEDGGEIGSGFIVASIVEITQNIRTTVNREFF